MSDLTESNNFNPVNPVNPLNSTNPPKISNKKIKKLMNNSMYKNMMNNSTSTSEGNTLKEKLTNKINSLKSSRMSQKNTELDNSKVRSKLQQRIDKIKNKAPDTTNSFKLSEENITSNSVKKYKKKLNELTKKYGEISDQQYIQNLEVITMHESKEKIVSCDDLNHSNNIINLYIKQNKNITEKELNLSDDE